MNIVRAFVAVVIVVAFAAFSTFLVVNADTDNNMEWERWIYVFGASEAIAFTAVGWVFGREVNRKRADDAEKRAEAAQEKAVEETVKGAKLAGLVRGSGPTLEAQGPQRSGLNAALEYAQRAYPD